MRYEDAASFRAALEARLSRAADSEGLGLTHLRKQVVFERLLARLMDVAPNRFVLKGALALEFRAGGPSRTTMDLDLGSMEEEEEVTEHMLTAAGLDLGDYFVFRSERVDVRDSGAGRTVRYRVYAELGGRQFDTVLLDVGLGEEPLWEPDRVQTPGFLEFVDLAPVSVPVITFEQQIAEKVHAYTRMYKGGRRSTRVKDLVDLVSIASRHSIRGDRLTDAIKAIFERRATHEVPRNLPDPPDEWSSALTRMLAEGSLPPVPSVAFSLITRMLDPALSGVASGVWDPEEGAWREPTD